MLPSVTTEIIRSRQKASDLEEQFTRLYESLPSPNVYFSPEWVYTWLSTLGQGHDVFFLVAFSEGHLAGVWPFFEYRLPVFGKALMPVASKAADLFDPIAIPEARESLLRTLLEVIPEFNFAWLPSLSRDFAEGVIEPFMAGQKYPHHLRQRTPRFFVELEKFNDFTTYTATVFGPKTRQNLRQKARNLSDIGEVEMRMLDTAKEITPWIPKMVQLEQASWKWQERAGVFQLEELRSFYQKLINHLAKSHRVRVCILTIDDRLVAHEIGFIGLDSYCMHSTVFDPAFAVNSPGRLLMLFSIQKCIEERRRIYDFLQNDAEFKRQMSTSESRIWDWIIFPNSLRGRICKLAIRTVQILKDWRYNPTRREGSLEREIMAAVAAENAKE